MGESVFRDILDVVCVLFPTFLFISPATIFWPAIRDKLQLEIPPLVVTSQTLQCSLWLIYAIGLEQWIAILPNFVGLPLGIVFCVVYPWYYKAHLYEWQYRCQMKLTIVMGVGFWIGAALMWLTTDDTFTNETASPLDVFMEITGWCAAGVGLFLLTHPLFTILRVLKTHNVAAMGSLSMNAITLISSVGWVVQGVVFIKSYPMIIQNGVGAVANLIALAVRFYFYARAVSGSPLKILEEHEYYEALRDGSRLSRCILWIETLSGSDTQATAQSDAQARSLVVAGGGGNSGGGDVSIRI